MEHTETNVIQAVIGLNDHPSITFNFDTNNFHSPDTVWFLESIEYNGATAVSSPKQFYQDIIEFCKTKL